MDDCEAEEERTASRLLRLMVLIVGFSEKSYAKVGKLYFVWNEVVAEKDRAGGLDKNLECGPRTWLTD